MNLTLEEAMRLQTCVTKTKTRRHFIGGSDARIIMGADEGALIRLMAGKARRSRVRRPFGQSDRPAWKCDRTPQSGLVRTQHRAGDNRRPALGSSPSEPVDGRYSRRQG